MFEIAEQKSVSQLKEEWQLCYAEVARWPLHPNDDFLTRDVLINPFFGHYGLAGYVITVEGSPIRALVLVNLTYLPGELFCLNGRRTIRINDSYRYSSSSKKGRFYEATFELLATLGLDDKRGHEDVSMVRVKSEPAPATEQSLEG